MHKTKNPKLTPYARKLRREMTKEERRLWYEFLKSLPLTVHRQKVLGPYIVDFYCASRRVAIELDGSQHYVEEGPDRDLVRDAWLREQGITVLRYTNLEVERSFRAVCEDILRHLGLEA